MNRIYPVVPKSQNRLHRLINSICVLFVELSDCFDVRLILESYSHRDH
jgi:hypothetical protein